MALKCPACGFESADDARWCDFCKEPFQKKKAEPAPAPLAEPAAPAAGPLSLKDLPREALERLPVELMPGQDGEKVPEAPQWLRPLALAFVGLVLLMISVLSALAVLRIRRAR